ncbi:protein kinase [Streptomyces collinus]|uniref:protein kinase n=1 Tax=Streptomyces collinus TaxID=42684 RepID=UPI0005BC1B0C|nr:protein kinase [Streptomyces collinus]UJA09944.1 serine/threonine protein kinase [Streptomyces collinus]UJA15192.1 serine/threonine protein kinase [Streptomyces collinus]
MDDYAGRVLADRYRLPLPPSDEYELTETRAFDTYSGQEVLVRQVPLPEVVEAEVLDAEGLPEGFTARERGARRAPAARTATRRPSDPAVRRAVEAAQAAARVPDHPRLDQVFDVFAEGGSLWIVSEWVAARPLSALLAEEPLTPYRAAEVASDVLMALRVLHAHGWVHRNITARTVLVCDDGRVMLTGLAVGAAEEALCGYDPVPGQDGDDGAALEGREGQGGGPGQDDPAGALGPGPAPGGAPGGPDFGAGQDFGGPDLGGPGGRGPTGGGVPVPPAGTGASGTDPEAARRAAIQARAAGGLPVPGANGVSGGPTVPGPAGRRALESGDDIRAARAGAIAAYRAGARAAARVQEAQQGGRPALPGARPPAEVEAGGDGTGGGPPPGRIADPYGVRGAPWHGATPRPGAGDPAAAPDTDRRPLGLPAAAPARLPLPGRTSAGHPDGPGHDGTGHDGTGHGSPGHGGSGQGGLGQGGPGHGGSGHGVTVPGQAPGPAADAGPAGSRWDEPGTAARRGPGTALAAERARQVRMTVVGPVTERWAPEQAGPVHENWQLAAPIGPATDLWALGALLFRAVQGHAPYPEESTAELVQMVCAEPPAFAEECGPLRPVVESLLRQDPTDRLDFEELGGWLRSLVRSAPEPDAGVHVVPVPPPDPSRLPIVRRRGELVRRRRAGVPATHPHGRHKRAREEAGSPRSLGRTLLLLILLLLAGAVAYAMLFMPKQGDSGAASGEHTGSAGQPSSAPSHVRQPSGGQPSGNTPDASASAPATETQTGGDPSVADGFTLRKDQDGFQVAVAKGWDRTPRNGAGQVVYSHGNFELLVVPGRDGSSSNGSDPMVYQRDKERELQPYRSSSWATATGLRTIEVGGRTMAEGQFTWTDGQGRDLYVRNMAILLNGRYHIVQVRGPEAERDEVTRLYDQAVATYRYTG